MSVRPPIAWVQNSAAWLSLNAQLWRCRESNHYLIDVFLGRLTETRDDLALPPRARVVA